MNVARLLLILVAFLTSGACGGKADGSLSKYTEEVSDGVLHNPYFKMKIIKPAEWVALDDSQTKGMMEMGEKIAAGGQRDIAAIMEATEKNQYPLFTFFRHEVGAPVEFNASVMGMAENISHAPGVKTGKDYFFHAKKLMAQVNPEYSFVEGYKQHEIGGVMFDQMDLTITVAGISAQQSYYATRYGDFMVMIIETNGDRQDGAGTKAVLDGIKFDW